MGTKALHPTCGTILKKVYVDMNLYQEIILLQSYFKGNWIVENVIGYYKPLILPKESGKHYFWANFNIGSFKVKSRNHDATIKEMERYKGFNLKGIDLGHRKDVILRNCIEPELGLHIFECAFKEIQQTIN